MTTLRKRITLVFSLLMATIVSLVAQDFQGKAYYQSARDMKGFEIKGDGMTPAMQEQLQAQMKKQFQKQYELTFNLTESVWKEEESLDGGPATAQSGGVVIRMSTGGGVTYKNTADNLYLRETEVFSKPFLVNDQLEVREWEITSETKKIGDYMVQKAIYTDIRERKMISFTSTNGEKESNEPEVVTDTIKVEAWYTPQIPVSQGPENYWGLPGLILEVNNGTTNYLCTKVVLNPEEEIVIKRPSKGKKVTREELRAETEAKSEEMMKKYSNGGRGANSSFTIKVGGGE